MHFYLNEFLLSSFLIFFFKLFYWSIVDPVFLNIGKKFHPHLLYTFFGQGNDVLSHVP